MVTTLQSALRPNDTTELESTAYTPQDLAQMALGLRQQRLDAATPFDRGLIRGVYNTGAGYANTLGQIVEPLSQDASKPIFDWAAEQQQKAQRYVAPGDVTSYEDVNSLSSAGKYVAGMFAENLPQLPAMMIGGGAARLGLRGAALPPFAKSMIGAGIGAAPMNMGEMVGGLREDPTIMANTTPMQRLATSAAYAVPAAALDAIPEALLMERALGAGKAVKNIFKDGVKASIKDGIKHVAKAVPEAALTEGVPEAAQQRTQQAILNQLNPDRDTSGDWKDIKESFFGGWAAGSPHSGVGRGMDVAWSQGRGAVDAARDLLSRKKLPEHLKAGSDEDVVGWDKQDDEQRNGWASRLSEAILGDPDAPQHLREKASEFMDKASNGVGKAWESLRDGLDIEERYNNGKAGVERFLGAAKRTYKDLGGMKENAEATPEDEIMYKAFGEHLDPKSSVARDTELKSNLFNTVKQSLLDDSWSQLPWHELEDEFGTIGRATAAVTQLRDGLVREGKLDYDDAFSKLLEASANDGQLGERAKMDVVKRYARLQFGEIDDSTARQIVRRMGDGLASYSSWDQKKRASFDRDLKKAFGDNSEKVLQALAPKQPKVEESENLEEVDLEKGVTPSLQEVTPDRRFVGQAVDKARRNEADGKTSTVRDHGGMWNLGHGSAETRAAIKENYIQTRRALQQQGAVVKTLKPLEYAEAAGISAKKIAENLGVFVKTEEEARAALRDHPARMLMVEKRGEVGLRNDHEQITKDDIVTLGETTQKKQKVAEGKHVDDATALAVRQALGNKDYAAGRKQLAALGFPNAVRVEQTSRGQKVVNNLNHGNAGRFEVHMNDSTVHTLSAQELIAFQQSRGRKDATGGSPLTHFTSALAQIMTNPDVKEVKVRKISGGEVKIDSAKYKAKSKDGQHTDKAAKLHADLTKQFGEFFELAPGLTLGKAVKKSGAWAGALNRQTELDEAADKQERLTKRLDEVESELMSEDVTDERMDELEGEAADIREQLDALEDEVKRLSEVQDMYEGVGEKQATAGEDTRPQSDKDMNASGLDNAADTTNDFNSDGTPKHPVKDVGRAVGDERKNTKIRGVNVMRLKAGVGAEDFTKPMQHALLKIRQALGIVKGRVATLDVAKDYIARAAAAQHDGNKKARDAFILMAQHHIYSALLDEANVLGYENGGEMTPEIQRLINAAAQFKEFEDKFQATKEATLKAAEGYGAFVEATPRTAKEKKAFQADPDRWTHHQRFLATLESKTDDEIKADGLARKARIESLGSLPNMSENMRQLLQLMREENDLARDVLRRRAGGETKAEAPKAEAPKAEAPKAEAPKAEAPKAEAPKADHAREERAKEAEKVEKEINDKLDDIESNTKKLTKNVADLIDGVRDAFNALKTAFIDGELNRDDLIAALRKSIAALRAAVGNVVDGVVKHSQGFIKGYRETKKAMEEMAKTAKARAQNKFPGVFATSNSASNSSTERIDAVLKSVASKFNDPNFNGTVTSKRDNWQALMDGGIFKLARSPIDGKEMRAMAAVVATIKEMYPAVNLDVILVTDLPQYGAFVVPEHNLFAMNRDKLMSLVADNADAKNRGVRFAVESLHHEVTHLLDAVGSIRQDGNIGRGGKVSSNMASMYNHKLRGDLVKGIGFVPVGELAKEAAKVARSFFSENAYSYPVIATNLVALRSFASEITAQSVAYYRTDPDRLKKLSPKLFEFAKEVSDAIETGDIAKIHEAIAGVQEDGNTAGTVPSDVAANETRTYRDHAKSFAGRESRGVGQERAATAKDWANLVLGLDELVDRAKDISQKIKQALKEATKALKGKDIEALKKSVALLLESGIESVKAAGRVLERILHARMYNNTVSATSNMAEWGLVLTWLFGVDAGPDTGTDGPTKSNSEGSFASGKGVTPEEMVSIKEYVAKVLGPKAHVALSEILGDASATWNRGTEKPVSHEMIRLYRGENAKNTRGGDWFHTDRSYAEKYGEVSYLDVTKQELGSNFAQGHHGRGEYVLVNSGKFADRIKPHGTDGEAYIRIAVNAANPMSKAHHEAMHEFFQRLLDSGSPAAETLRRASSTASVLNQIRKFFKDDPNYAKINEALNDPHERVAYMYQLWAAGAINLGPNTQGVFAKISAAFRKIFGLITSGQHSQAIMEQFHDGKLSTPSDVARVLGQNAQAKQGYLAAAEKWLTPLAETARELVITAQNELIDSGNKSLEKIGRMFSNETGAHDKDISLMSARVMKTNQMADRFVSIIRGLDDKQIDALRTAMQTGKTAADPDVARAQARLRKMFDDIHAYLKEAGVDLPKLDDYFPRAWDHLAISANRDEFVKLLVKEANMTEAHAQQVADTLIKNRGAEPLTEGEYRVGFTPFMAAANKRVLDFTPSEAMAKFQSQDMAGTVMTYVQHAVHKAEYARRFGARGEKLRQMMQDAVGEEVGSKAWDAAKTQAEADFKRTQDDLKQRFGKDFDKIADGLYKAGYKNGEVDIEHIAKHLAGDPAKAFKQFDAQLRRAQRAIMAMEGTLGYDVSNLLRKLNSGIIVYENMRLLSMSLFSQVIDPLGVAVRGGTLKDAWNTFKLGLQGTVAGWRGKPVESSAMALAMKLGIVDASNFLNSQGQAYSGLYMGETAKKFNDRLFRWNGVEGFSQGTRVGAMLAAIEFIKFHAGKGNEHSVRYLAELGLTKEDVKLVDGELDYTDRKVQHAIFRWVDSAVLRPNAAMRPSWASDPHWALLFHMKQFTYAAHKVFLERIYNEAKHGNLSPALTMMLTYVPAMIAADFLRGLLANGGKEPPWKRGWGFGDYLVEGVERAGLLGIPQLALDTAKYGPTELTGPFGAQIAKAAKTYNYAAAKDRALDYRAASTGLEKDRKRAEDFDATKHTVRRTLRDALPLGSITKKLVYDPLEHAVADN